MTTHRMTNNRRAATRDVANRAAGTPENEGDPVFITVQQQGPLLVRMKDIPALLGCASRTTVWRWVSDESFPAPVDLPSGTSVWRVADVVAWVNGLRRRE